MILSVLQGTLNRKIAVLFVVLGICLGVGGYAAVRTTVLPTFVEFERNSARDIHDRAADLIAAELKAIDIVNGEYSRWDQTYDYALGRRPAYRAENLDPAYWSDDETHMMVLADASGELLYGALVDPRSTADADLGAVFGVPLTPVRQLLLPELGDSIVSGLLQTRRGLLLAVSHPILRSDGAGPVAGRLVTGQLLTDERLAQFAEALAAVVRIFGAESVNAPERAAAVIERLAGAGDIVLTEVEENAVHTFEMLHDINGEPISVLEVVTSREISAIGAATIRAAGWALGAAGAFFLLAALLFINRSIVSPVRRLTDRMLRIQETGDLSTEVSDFGRDEVGLLGREFEVLTSRLGETQQQLESARDEALELARTKSEFLARMSHEIRTPMNGVLGMTELLRDTPLNPKQQRFARTIHDSAVSLLEIINDILDFSKIEAGKLQLETTGVDLQNLLEETIDGVATSAAIKDVELLNRSRLDLETEVHIDPARLRQVLTNLLANGIKFTNEGEVALNVTATPAGASDVQLDFEVRDTGIGIRPQKQSVIFDSFTQEDGSTTRDYGGTGLGLAICKQLVEMMGGEITVQSAPGKGSTFSFSIRAATGKKLEDRAHLNTSSIAGRRILVVDDNATNREILEHQLTGWRAECDVAASAAEALDQLAEAHRSGAGIDVILLDIHMPGTDGIALAHAIRERSEYDDTIIIVLSSIAESVASAHLAGTAVSGHLVKPVRQADLYDTLVMALAGEQPGSALSRAKVREARLLTGRVLLAEDNAVNRLVAAGMLEAMGIQVLQAKDGAEAVQKCGDEKIDLVLMDCQMPNMDGFEATRVLRKDEVDHGRPRLPIVALTANALKGDRERCLDAGMDEYLSKPFTSEQLHALLAHFLPSPGTSSYSTDPGAVRPESGTTEGEPPIDSRVLDGLAELQTQGDDDFVASVVAAYCESAEDARRRLTEAIAAGDAARIQEIAHGLKSSSANVGAVTLSRVCEKLESMGRLEDLAELSEVHETFEQEFSRALIALRQEFEPVSA